MGKVYAFKTDTVWGFGCEAQDREAVEKIYEIKKRDSKKPLILMSNSFDNLEKYIKFIPEYAYELIEKYLPGALTLIFEKSSFCPDFVTSGANTVGVRVPNSPDFENLIQKTSIKVFATTSCNVSSEPPVEDYNQACLKFSENVTIIKPISDTKNENIPSTVLLCEKDGYKVLRMGVIKL